MDLPSDVRALLGAAGDDGLPFAVWRRPDGARHEAVIACEPVCRRTIFGADTRETFFAISGFAAESANVCDAIVGDVVVRGSEVTYLDGDAYRPAPVTAIQRRLAERARGRDPFAPLRADGSDDVPVQTGEADYKALVEKAVAEIDRGTFRKVVTSRCEARPLPAGTDCLALYEALAEKLPAAFVALVNLPGKGAWLVGTPETLLSVRGDALHTIALAGTQWAKDGVPLPDVCWPDKIIEEQALVAAYIRRSLDAAGLTSFDEKGPRTVAAANLVHLRSDFVVELEAGDKPLLGALLDRLNPTSAVLGMPKQPALAFLTANEGYDRDYYTGFLGPVGFDGNTDLYVNLRTSRIIGDTAYLYVGGGIVAQSQPDVEWQETVEKSKTVGTILNAGAGRHAPVSATG
ncbi:isochorismate synthase [Amorphus suaedae]